MPRGSVTSGSSTGPGVDRFREYLQRYNHPVTPQRLRVAEAVFGTHRHVSADEILERLRGEGGRIGKATVYRTLDLLLRAGLIREHDFGEGFKRYEPRPTRPHHEHLVCTRCGKVIEIEAPDVERTLTEIARLHDFVPRDHKLEIYGLCEDCHE